MCDILRDILHDIKCVILLLDIKMCDILCDIKM